ncbi:MAG TPA: exo-beta-N-acetylmuramidase NamZ domain-containing protein [Polyangiaceae bacterium]|nr:exo-beta-N-acetylmuramidase NamZ domain-containing protein [Polyangiaceae bacterium]
MPPEATRDELVPAPRSRDVRLAALVVLGASLVLRDPAPVVRSADTAAGTTRSIAATLQASFAPVVDLAPIQKTGAAEPTPSAVVKGIDDAVAAALADNKLPGCVVTIGRRDRVLFQKAYGMRQVDPDKKAMTIDTVFDLASLTKPLATATSIMVLVDRGRIGLDEPVLHFLPEFWMRDKRTITIRQLLTHVSGLPAETIYEDYKHGRTDTLRRLANTALITAPGARFTYSDVGFLILEDVVARVSGKDLATFATENVYRPLGMVDTGYLPGPSLQSRIAPTEYRDGGLITGDVHDPRAYFLGGVAGHAGLFSTANDLVRYAQMILNEGELSGVRVFSRETVRAMLAPHDVPGGVRALGWDMQTHFSVNKGETLSRRAVGHGGYTGTALWMDPELDLFVLFLSNRVHPDGRGAVNPLIGRIGTIAGEKFGRRPPPVMIAAELPTGTKPALSTPAQVEVGIDVLKNENFARLRGARVGLITNASGRDGEGARTVDVLQRAPGVTLVALFAPEHGLFADVEQRIENGSDDGSRLPVYSLYGARFSPSDEMLAGIDTLVFDIQDVGARFYTYASTMHRTLAVAAKNKLRVLVLDRPNPIDGIDVAGPLPAPGDLSFVNHHPLPIRHGMTLGELAEMINADEHLGAELEVVRMRGWRRAAYFDQTGLVWTPPSPNLRSVAEAVLYPGVALVEGTNVSVGRGTDTPFEVVGAPWIDDRLADRLQAASLPGVAFASTQFTPTASTYAGRECTGIRLAVTDRAGFEPIRTGVAIAQALQELYPSAWKTDKLNGIIANRAVTNAILSGRPLSDIEAMWKPDLEAFRNRRKKYLLYADAELQRP